MKRLFIFGILYLSTITLLAQDALGCPALEQSAIQNVLELCNELEGGVCYGNPSLSLIPFDDTDDSRFSLPGDVVPVEMVHRLFSSTEENTWGIALIQSETYPVDTWLLQSVTMAVFGTVSIENMGNEGITAEVQLVEIATTEGANVRALPTSEGRLIETLFVGDVIQATGRSSDAQWVRVQTRAGETGWISIFAIEENIQQLPETDTNDDAPDLLYLPLQAMNIQTGLNDAGCEEGIESGVLIQTSTSEGHRAFDVNEVSLQFAGTVFLQVQPEAGLLVHAVDGNVQVITGDIFTNVPAGAVLSIPMELDEDGLLLASGQPGSPQSYDYESMLRLPYDVLPLPVFVGVDLATIIQPRPVSGESPIAGMALDAQCTITVGEDGSNIRVEPSTNAPIRGVMSYRESAQPIARANGLDGLPWWQLAEGVWVRVNTTVTGGDCISVPNIEFP